MHQHFIAKCKHGVVVSQCRCPSKDNAIRLVACPDSCTPATEKPAEEAAPERISDDASSEGPCERSAYDSARIFFYILARDHLPTGVIESIFAHHVEPSRGLRSVFSIPELAAIAHSWTTRLGLEVRANALSKESDAHGETAKTTAGRTAVLEGGLVGAIQRADRMERAWDAEEKHNDDLRARNSALEQDLAEANSRFDELVADRTTTLRDAGHTAITVLEHKIARRDALLRECLEVVNHAGDENGDPHDGLIGLGRRITRELADETSWIDGALESPQAGTPTTKRRSAWCPQRMATAGRRRADGEPDRRHTEPVRSQPKTARAVPRDRSCRSVRSSDDRERDSRR